MGDIAWLDFDASRGVATVPLAWGTAGAARL